VSRGQGQGWIGCDFDGTLARWESWGGPTELGEPVPRMVNRVRAWLDQGRDVRIMTARANPKYPEASVAVPAIRRWCLAHVGRVLPVTWEKDYEMAELWDDRAVGVVPNIGLSHPELFQAHLAVCPAEVSP